MAKRKTKLELECENARLRAEIEGYKAALKITQDYAELLKLAIPKPDYYPYVDPYPVEPYPNTGSPPFWPPTITWCTDNVTITDDTASTSFKVSNA